MPSCKQTGTPFKALTSSIWTSKSDRSPYKCSEDDNVKAQPSVLFRTIYNRYNVLWCVAGGGPHSCNARGLRPTRHDKNPQGTCQQQDLFQTDNAKCCSDDTAVIALAADVPFESASSQLQKGMADQANMFWLAHSFELVTTACNHIWAAQYTAHTCPGCMLARHCCGEGLA